MEPLGVGLVGAGYWGSNLARNLRSYEGTRLAWVCDLSMDRARALVSSQAETDTRAAGGLAPLLDDSTVEAVVLATPPTTHAELATRALEAGKHVLVEKPLATSVSAGERLVKLACERDLVLMCDHTFCYTPAVRKIRSLVQEGSLGEIQYVDSVRINLGLIDPDMDVFWDLAPHDLSILDFVLPDVCAPVAIAAQSADPVGVGHASIGYLSLPLRNGGIAHVHVNWLSPTKIRTTIIGGSRRMLVWDDLHPAQRLMVFDRGVELDRSLESEERRRALISYRTGDMVAPALEESEALAGVVREFAAAVREGRPPLTDGEAGLRVLRILEDIEKSLASGGARVPTGTGL